MQAMNQPHSQGSAQSRQPRQQSGQQVQSGQRAGTRRPQRLFQTQNFLHEQVRRASIQALNQSLADATVMHSQLKSAHWNVKGPNFYQLHELFDDLAAQLEAHIDELAERATALGGVARGSTYEAARESRLDPIPAETCEETALLNQVARNLSQLDSELNWHMEAIEKQGDLDTVDLLNEVSRDVSKMLWFVEAHLQGPTPGQGAVRQPGGTASQHW